MENAAAEHKRDAYLERLGKWRKAKAELLQGTTQDRRKNDTALANAVSTRTLKRKSESTADTTVKQKRAKADRSHDEMQKRLEIWKEEKKNKTRKCKDEHIQQRSRTRQPIRKTVNAAKEVVKSDLDVEKKVVKTLKTNLKPDTQKDVSTWIHNAVPKKYRSVPSRLLDHFKHQDNVSKSQNLVLIENKHLRDENLHRRKSEVLPRPARDIARQRRSSITSTMTSHTSDRWYSTNRRTPSNYQNTKVVAKDDMNRRKSEIHATSSKQSAGSILKRKSTPGNVCLAPITEGKENGFSSEDNINFTKTGAIRVHFASNRSEKKCSKYRMTPYKMSSEQTERRHKLDEWLAVHNKTPTAFRHLLCFDHNTPGKEYLEQPLMKNSLSIDELSQQKEAMDTEFRLNSPHARIGNMNNDAKDELASLNRQLSTLIEECNTLRQAGCPVDDILSWMNTMEKNIPVAKLSADFWIFKAELLQSTGSLNKVLEVFEQAVRNSAKPADKLATALTQIVKDTCEASQKPRTQTPKCASRVLPENVFESSTIKYCVRQETPLKKAVKTDDVANSGTVYSVVTPVRRSTRRSLAAFHQTFNDSHVYAAINDIPDDEKRRALYQANLALDM